MPIVPPTELQLFHSKAVELGLDRRRDLLLSTLPVTFVAQLRVENNPSDQLFSDLAEFNKDRNARIIGDVCPIAEWLRGAAVFSSSYPDEQAYWTRWATVAAEKAAQGGAQPGEHVGAAGGISDLPERIIGSNDLLPAGFLEAALAASSAVVRLVVPVFRGTRQVMRTTGGPLQGYGTGWLVGPRHLLTNHHVIDNRDPSTSAAADADFQLQGRGTVAEFDYLSEGQGSGRSVPVAGVAACHATLDYALLELAEPVTDRAPLTLAAVPLALGGEEHPAVNVIQHPRGAPKHVALRNNLVAALNGDDLAYYADTEAGSSGAPVADDRWRVVALHKASTMRFRNLNFQGKPAAWVNIGTPIQRIVQDIERQDRELWASVGARFG